MMNVHMRSAGEIAGKGLHQAKTIHSSSLRVSISTGTDLLSMFGCGLVIVTRLESDRGFLQHTFACALQKFPEIWRLSFAPFERRPHLN